MHDIKQRLKQLRLDKGLTMMEFAKLISVSPGNVGDWESESRTSIPGAKALISIATTFHVSLDWLLLGQTTSTSIPAKQQANAQHDAPPSPLTELFQSLSAEDQLLMIGLATRLAHLSKVP
ncbi:helix-turn-helix domain-containing protein [Paenibacillus paridis]|uniref:helix-turn-helix domain-containing protein n=1 Tax=Paenibacillus paridis TaxID=2583376 RepID=UPI00111D42E4|nr:helix-turn-helix transcriptional regulator [Paenibacillus paridis]